MKLMNYPIHLRRDSSLGNFAKLHLIYWNELE